jgi:hypothetical protein
MRQPEVMAFMTGMAPLCRVNRPRCLGDVGNVDEAPGPNGMAMPTLKLSNQHANQYANPRMPIAASLRKNGYVEKAAVYGKHGTACKDLRETSVAQLQRAAARGSQPPGQDTCYANACVAASKRRIKDRAT